MFTLKINITAIAIFFICFSCELNSQWVRDNDLSYPGGVIQIVHMIDTGTIWGLGSISIYPFDTSCIVVKSPQYGINYFLPDLPYQVIYNCIAGINADTAFIGSEYGKIYRTNNGYNFFEVLDAGSSDYIVNSIQFSKENKNTGYIMCSKPYGPASFKIFKTTDFGESWQTIIPDFGSGYYNGYAACVTDSQHVWYGLNCITSNCPFIRIAYTTNGGINWLTSDQDPGRRAYIALTFKTDNQYGLSLSHLNNTPARMQRSANGGANWIITNNLVNNFTAAGLISVPGSTVWYLASNGNDSNNVLTHIYKSTNEGLTWYDMTFSIDPGLILGIDAVRSGDLIYSYSSTAAGIFKLIDTAVIIGINNNNGSVPVKYSLYQNYPNPFNPITTIKYEIPKDSKVKLVIYDLSGREIKTLVNNEIKSAGYYKLEFNMQNYASGMYFYRIKADDYSGNTFVDTKKMVLVK